MTSKVTVIFCKTCNDAALYINGKRVNVDRLVSNPTKAEKDGHVGVTVTWEEVVL